jgi:hypothetical protein
MSSSDLVRRPVRPPPAIFVQAFVERNRLQVAAGVQLPPQSLDGQKMGAGRSRAEMTAGSVASMAMPLHARGDNGATSCGAARLVLRLHDRIVDGPIVANPRLSSIALSLLPSSRI